MYVCVTGPDGSGKTTQIAKLADRLERRAKKKIVAVTIWDLLLDPQSKDKISFKSPVQVDDYLSILGTPARGLFLYHCFQQALELARRRPADLYLINAYWYKYFATEVAHGADAQQLLKIADLVFPEPAVTFYLRTTPEEAARRKTRLSRYESGFADPRTKEAFVDFQKRTHATLESLADQRRWTALNGTESPDALTDSILKHIDTSC